MPENLNINIMKNKKLKVIALSDTHGNLPQIKEEFDLMLVCGDVCPAHGHYYAYQKEWILSDYCDWINSLPFHDERSQVVMVGGNHDFFFERATDEDIAETTKNTNSRLVVLKNETYEFEYADNNGRLHTLKIFGTPYCKKFGNWAFNLSDESLRKKYKKCPEGIDIIISHDSPVLNELGKINQGWQKGKNVGNAVLDELIYRVKPKWFFSGHIHTGNHNLVETKAPDCDDIIRMANVSYLDEDYMPAYEPLILEI